ncbi:MAG: hypothetical protein ACLP8B_03930 [Xanthobacteraceae bacterium]
MLKYASKFFLEILPSVVATVVGAYIVNHYIAPHGYYGYGEPPRAAVSHVDSPQPAKGATADLTPAPVATPAHDPKPAKGADKAPARAPTDKAQNDKAPGAAKDAIKEIIKETAKPEPEPRRFVTRDRAADKVPPPAPAETASIPPAIVTAPAVPEDHPDAAELARAALDRLRTADPAARPADAPSSAVVVHEAPHDPVRDHVNVVTAVPPPAEARPAAPPLPPPVSVAAPADRPGLANASAPDAPPHAFPHTADADRMVPPADIPGAAPVDLQPAPPKKKSVAEDMLSAARSVFQSVVSQQN